MGERKLVRVCIGAAELQSPAFILSVTATTHTTSVAMVEDFWFPFGRGSQAGAPFAGLHQTKARASSTTTIRPTAIPRIVNLPLPPLPLRNSEAKDRIDRRPRPDRGWWRRCHEGGEGMARGAVVWGRGGGGGKFCCSFKRITVVVCCVNLVAALLVLRTFYTSFSLVSSSDPFSGTRMARVLL